MTTPSTGRVRGRGPQAATAQVSRMLALVPFITRRPGVTLADLAAEFGVSPDQVEADLSLLMMCGEPGYYPNELIDVVLDEDGGSVSIAYDAGLDRPVRLSPEEAVTLTVAVRTLAELPELGDVEAVHSLAAKLEDAVGDVPGTLAVAPPETGPMLGTVREALRLGRRLHLTYYTASRDETTEREVDPIRLIVVDGHSYLEGYCYRAEAVRRFRVDRIDDATLLPEAAQQALWVDDAVPAALFTPRQGSSVVTLRLARSAAWIAEYYVAEPVADTSAGTTAGDAGRSGAHDGTDGVIDGSADGNAADRANQGADDGSLTVRLAGPDDEWLVRLVLSLGGAARIVDREDLAAEVRRRAAAALVAYDVAPAPAAPDGGADEGRAQQ